MPSDFLSEIVPEVGVAITQLSGIVRGLVEDAYIDRLTRLPNGVALQRFEAVKERSHTFGAVFVDLTGFKAINDQHGHAAGDAALRIAGETLAEIAARHQGHAFRKSGDEFVLLTRKHDEATSCAKEVAQRLAQGLTFPYENTMLEIHGAVGFSLRQDNDTTLSALIEQADHACRAAKDEGSTIALPWNQALVADDLKVERKRCSNCSATTSLMSRSSRRGPNALDRCANCGEAFGNAAAAKSSAQ